MADAALLHPVSVPIASSVHICPACHKPFATDRSLTRHKRYCGSRVRTRQRSCRACGTAKTKCNFGQPCSRCDKKNIDCRYDGGAVPQLTASPAVVDAVAESLLDVAPGVWSLPTDEALLFEPNNTFASLPGLDSGQSAAVSHDDSSSEYLTGSGAIPLASHPELSTLAGSTIQDQISWPSDVTLGLYHNPMCSPFASWCSWPSTGASLSALSEKRTIELSPTSSAVLQTHSFQSHYNADHIIQSLRAVPTMMLRKETFPWFIHAYSHSPHQPDCAFPQALSTCMAIAQIFVSRTAETRPFLWSTIMDEIRRLRSEKLNMSDVDLLAANQACMAYAVMGIVDQCPQSAQASPELLSTLGDLYVHFKSAYAPPYALHFMVNTSSDWNEWVFVESQRRVAHLWFLIGCVVCIKSGLAYDPMQSYRTIPLPGPKLLWEARTRAAFDKEFSAGGVLRSSGLISLGDLMDAQQSSHLADSAQKLDRWNASVDNLGLLLGLVGPMLT